MKHAPTHTHTIFKVMTHAPTHVCTSTHNFQIFKAMKHTHTHTQTDTDTDTHTQRHTHRHIDTDTHTHRHKHTHTEAHTHTHKITRAHTNTNIYINSIPPPPPNLPSPGLTPKGYTNCSHYPADSGLEPETWKSRVQLRYLTASQSNLDNTYTHTMIRAGTGSAPRRRFLLCLTKETAIVFSK